MSCKHFYVYQYNNTDGSPFYIGKGSKNRINESHSPWITIPAPEYRTIVKDNLTEKEAFDLELTLIKLYGRKQDGGILENKKISRWVAQAGWHHSSKTKEKISVALTGKKRSEEQRKKYKKPKSLEHAEKIRQANLGRIDDGRYIKVSNTMKEKRWFTNGVESVFCQAGNQPLGFVPGRTLRRSKDVMA